MPIMDSMPISSGHTLMKYTQVYQVADESDVSALIEEHQEMHRGLVTYKVDHKVKRSKGEIIDEFWLVTINHDLTK
jgi:hypothetical protein